MMPQPVKGAGPGIDPRVIRPRPGRPEVLTVEGRRTLNRLRRLGRRSGALSPHTYNVAVSHTYRFVWFRNAKAGTRTMLSYLTEQHADADLLVASSIPYPTAAFADYFKFGLVRHPLDRFISAWQDKVHRENHFGFDDATREQMRTIENFAAWVSEQDLRSGEADRHISLQARVIDLNQVDFLGRMETFDEDFATVCRTVGLPVRTPERRNRSAPQGVSRDNASRELRSIVEEKYRLDYQILGY